MFQIIKHHKSLQSVGTNILNLTAYARYICFHYVDQTLQQPLPMVGFNITFLQLIANIMVRFK